MSSQELVEILQTAGLTVQSYPGREAECVSFALDQTGKLSDAVTNLFVVTCDEEEQRELEEVLRSANLDKMPSSVVIYFPQHRWAS